MTVGHCVIFDRLKGPGFRTTAVTISSHVLPHPSPPNSSARTPVTLAASCAAVRRPASPSFAQGSGRHRSQMRCELAMWSHPNSAELEQNAQPRSRTSNLDETPETWTNPPGVARRLRGVIGPGTATDTASPPRRAPRT